MLRELFADNAVEYFVSYYDYYQPEAYVEQKDTFIEKDASIHDEIDRLRHSATRSLLTREDVIVVASVSAIYGLGDPRNYVDMSLRLEQGQEIGRDELLGQLIIRSFRKGGINVLVGINLLREGLDISEVSLVAILDADQEGFLRSTTTLVQTMSCAARNVTGEVVLYANKRTDRMTDAIEETRRRRAIH